MSLSCVSRGIITCCSPEVRLVESFIGDIGGGGDSSFEEVIRVTAESFVIPQLTSESSSRHQPLPVIYEHFDVCTIA